MHVIRQDVIHIHVNIPFTIHVHVPLAYKMNVVPACNRDLKMCDKTSPLITVSLGNVLGSITK